MPMRGKRLSRGVLIEPTTMACCASTLCCRRPPGALLADVWVAGERGFGKTKLRLIADQAIVAQMVTPPFARAGDHIGASIRLEASDGMTRETNITLRFPDGTSTVQVTTIPEAGVTSIPFTFRAPSVATLEMQATVATGAAFSETLRTALPGSAPRSNGYQRRRRAGDRPV